MMTVSTPTVSPEIDTTIPGSNRRRVWQAPELVSHSLITMTLVRLHLAPQGTVIKPEAVEAIHQGGDLESIFGPLATTIELSTIQRIKLDLVENRLRIDYRPTGFMSPTLEQTGKQTIPLTIEFRDAELADSFYTKLWRRLGNAMVLQKQKRDVYELAQAPLGMMLGVVMMTGLLCLASGIHDDLGGAWWLPNWIGNLDWRIACGFCGAVLALLQIWLYRRLTQPPTYLILARQQPY